jgi:hypothetical protein
VTEFLRATVPAPAEATLAELIELAEVHQRSLTELADETLPVDEVMFQRRFVLAHAPDMLPQFEGIYLRSLREGRAIIKAALSEIEARMAERTTERRGEAVATRGSEGDEDRIATTAERGF